MCKITFPIWIRDAKQGQICKIQTAAWSEISKQRDNVYVLRGDRSDWLE